MLDAKFRGDKVGNKFGDGAGVVSMSARTQASKRRRSLQYQELAGKGNPFVMDVSGRRVT